LPVARVEVYGVRDPGSGPAVHWVASTEGCGHAFDRAGTDGLAVRSALTRHVCMRGLGASVNHNRQGVVICHGGSECARSNYRVRLFGRVLRAAKRAELLSELVGADCCGARAVSLPRDRSVFLQVPYAPIPPFGRAPPAMPLRPCPFGRVPSAMPLQPCPFGHAPSATTRPKLAPTPKAATPIVAECKNPPTFATCRASVVADLNRSCVHNDQVSYCSLGTRKCSLATAHTRALTPSRDSLGSQSLQFSLPIHPPTSPPTNTTHSRAGALTQPRLSRRRGLRRAGCERLGAGVAHRLRQQRTIAARVRAAHELHGATASLGRQQDATGSSTLCLARTSTGALARARTQARKRAGALTLGSRECAGLVRAERHAELVIRSGHAKGARSQWHA
jgi:hypothetical protein